MDWLEKAQKNLLDEGLAGWLIYDFRGSNPIATKFLKLKGMFSRRIYCFVPADGLPTLLVHAIEAGTVKDFPMLVRTYSNRQSLELALKNLIPQDTVALEYSPNNDIPYVSFVDAGTVDLIRSLGVEVVSSANLLQSFALWTPSQHRAHLEAAEHVVNAKDVGFNYLSLHAPMGKTIRETDVQKVITDYFDSHGLEYDHPPIVGFAEHAGDPHYVPKLGKDKTLEKGDVVLIDLWAKIAKEDAPYADITFVGVWGEVSEEVQKVWEVVSGARDIALKAIKRAYEEGRYPEGREIDRVTRNFIRKEGFGEAFIHRTGHSLGTQFTHGDAAHLDDYETCDTRELRPGFGITIEPGVYLDDFGIRSEINVLLTEEGPKVTTEIQKELIVIQLIF